MINFIGGIYKGKFVVKTTKTGYMFNLKATNGQVIAVGEGYKRYYRPFDVVVWP